jgi:II/X family phage/plasmid replication protein
MIDWITAVIKFKHPRIACGSVMKIDEHGQIIRHFPTTKRFEGSFESSMAVASNDVDESREWASTLFIDGNPSKFLQGHNVVGSDDINLLVHGAIRRICSVLGFDMDGLTSKRIFSGHYIIKRIDINHYYELGSYENVKQFIDALSKKAKSRSGRAMSNKGTVYFNKHSKRWAFKFYSKFREITEGGKGHSIDNTFYNTPMIEWSRTKVRAELVLRKLELLKIAQLDSQYASEIFAYQLTEKKLGELFTDYIERIDMTAQMNLQQNEVLQLPVKLRGTYMLWKQGLDLRESISRTTLYRHRTELRDYGVDIALPPLELNDSACNVVPIVKVIEAKPVSIPESFRHLKLIHS